jgi:hypothetical protein
MMMLGDRMSQLSGMQSMLSPSMGGGDKSNFDSSPTNYSSGTTRQLFGSGGSGLSDNTGFAGGTQRQVEPNQTDGTLLGTSGTASWGQGGQNSWIDQQLDAVHSTDSKDYWHTQAGQDSKFMSGDESAKNWWLDAIRRGEGSELVKNGTLKTRGSGEEDRGPGSMLGFGNSGNSNGMGQIMPLLMQLLRSQGQRNQVMPQQAVSNGSLFGNAGNAGQQNQMDISSFLQNQNGGFSGGMNRHLDGAMQ